MNAKKIASITACFALVAGIAFAVPALAQTNNNQGQQGSHRNGQASERKGLGIRPAVVGTVSAINGSSLTVNGRQGFGSSTATVIYTVDASNATVKKNNATSTVSSIVVGDNVFIQGTVSGTNVVATTIRDGAPGMRGEGNRQKMGTSTPIGNGQPVVFGKTTAVNGTSLTVTTASNVTYTVDATNAKVMAGKDTASSLSNIAVGDRVLVQGTVNGTSINATTVVDQSKNNPGNNSATNSKPRGFFGGIGQFFMHMFGF